ARRRRVPVARGALADPLARGRGVRGRAGEGRGEGVGRRAALVRHRRVRDAVGPRRARLPGGGRGRREAVPARPDAERRPRVRLGPRRAGPATPHGARLIRVVVVGGGVAGLATAWFLTRRAPPDLALSVRVLEAAPAVGGGLASRVEGGAVLEPGAVALQDGAPDTRDLVEGVGLAPRRVPCDPRWRRRLVFHEGRLLPVPA